MTDEGTAESTRTEESEEKPDVDLLGVVHDAFGEVEGGCDAAIDMASLQQDGREVGTIVERAAVIRVAAMEEGAVEVVVAHEGLPGIDPVAKLNRGFASEKGDMERGIAEKAEGRLPHLVGAVAVEGGHEACRESE